MSKIDGGPAFPLVDESQGHPAYKVAKGMSLRDWFAGMALQGICASFSQDADVARAIIAGAKDCHVGSSQFLGRICYDYADAMLAERSKTEGA